MSDAWTLSYDSFQSAEERQREALCTLGNGYPATRGSAPEPGSGGHRGTYLAGCYDRLTSRVAGVETDDESTVNVTDWLRRRFGQWLLDKVASNRATRSRTSRSVTAG
jgi:trehalose 6-phosphate phosphatase